MTAYVNVRTDGTSINVIADYLDRLGINYTRTVEHISVPGNLTTKQLSYIRGVVTAGKRIAGRK